MSDYTINIKNNTTSAISEGGLKESGGQDLSVGAVADGEFLKRSGTSIIGGTTPAPVDATTSVKGIVELATDGENAANVVVQGDDSRLVTKTHTVTTTTYTAGTNNETVILADTSTATGANGAITINLPAASSSTNENFYVKKIDADANNVIIDGNSTETIDGAETKVISTQWDAVQVVCDGSEWFII